MSKITKYFDAGGGLLHVAVQLSGQSVSIQDDIPQDVLDLAVECEVIHCQTWREALEEGDRLRASQ